MVAYASRGAVFFAAVAAVGASRSEARRLGEDLDMRRLAAAADDGRLGSHLSFKVDLAHRLVVGGEIEALAARVSGSLGCGPASRVFRHAGKHEAEHEAFGLHAWYRVACAPAAASDRSARAFAALSSFLASGDHDGVSVVEAELAAAASWAPDDEFYEKQEAHYRAIGLESAWDSTTGRGDVVVQVVDLGADTSHPDLEGRLWTNPGEICDNGVDDDGNGYVDDCHGYDHHDGDADPSDGDGHGTFCAGVVGACAGIKRSRRLLSSPRSAPDSLVDPHTDQCDQQ